MGRHSRRSGHCRYIRRDRRRRGYRPPRLPTESWCPAPTTPRRRPPCMDHAYKRQGRGGGGPSCRLDSGHQESHSGKAGGHGGRGQMRCLGRVEQGRGRTRRTGRRSRGAREDGSARAVGGGRQAGQCAMGGLRGGLLELCCLGVAVEGRTGQALCRELCQEECPSLAAAMDGHCGQGGEERPTQPSPPTHRLVPWRNAQLASCAAPIPPTPRSSGRRVDRFGHASAAAVGLRQAPSLPQCPLPCPLRKSGSVRAGSTQFWCPVCP